MQTKLSFLVAVPKHPDTYRESANLRGYPAAHAVVQGQRRTLCGKNPDGWMIDWDAKGTEDVTCKTCRRILAQKEPANG